MGLHVSKCSLLIDALAEVEISQRGGAERVLLLLVSLEKAKLELFVLKNEDIQPAFLC